LAFRNTGEFGLLDRMRSVRLLPSRAFCFGLMMFANAFCGAVRGASSSEALLGEWTRVSPELLIIFKSDGTFSGKRGAAKGKWNWIEEKERRLLIDHGRTTETVTLSDDGQRIAGKDKGGASVEYLKGDHRAFTKVANAATPAPTKPAPPDQPEPLKTPPADAPAAPAAPVAPVAATAPAAATAASAPESPTGKWLAEQDPGWQAAFQRDVQDLFVKAVADLKKQYVAALETQILAASREAKLDEAVAFRAERDSVAGGGDVPVGEDAAVPAVLNALRAGFARNYAVLATERAAKAKALHARYDAILAQNQIALTQRQRFDEALEIKAKREEINAVWLGATAAVAPASPQPATAATPTAPGGGLATFVAGLPQQVDLFLSGSYTITLNINNKEAIAGVIRDKASKVRVSLHEGNVVAVKNEGRWDQQNFLLSCISLNGQLLFESSEKWTSYIPADEKKWWVIKGAKEQQPAARAPDRQDQVDTVKKAMKETPLNHGNQPIRSNLKGVGSAGRTTYLFYIVTRADMLPKPDPTGAAK
jgi:hypothetical protein